MRIRNLLESEPLARIMTGDLELFHSNFLAWLFDAMPETADRLFARFLRPGAGRRRRVLREWRRFDLVLEWPGHQPLVIENKVKSLPDSDQLDRYAATLIELGEVDGTPVVSQDDGGLIARPILLTMVEPGTERLGSRARDGRGRSVGWDVLTYRVLAGELREAVGPEPDSYEKETVVRYAGVVDALARLTRHCMVESTRETLDLPGALVAAFAGTTMLSALRKMRGYLVAGAVRRILRDSGVGGPVIPEFSNGTSLMTWWADTSTPEGMVPGVQVQAGQVRRCAKMPHLAARGKPAHEARAAYAATYPEYFDLSAFGPHVRVMPVPKEESPGFNRFDPDFVYRYVKSPDLTVDALARLLIRWASEMRDTGPQPAGRHE